MTTEGIRFQLWSSIRWAFLINQFNFWFAVTFTVRLIDAAECLLLMSGATRDECGSCLGFKNNGLLVFQMLTWWPSPNHTRSDESDRMLRKQEMTGKSTGNRTFCFCWMLGYSFRFRVLNGSESCSERDWLILGRIAWVFVRCQPELLSRVRIPQYRLCGWWNRGVDIELDGWRLASENLHFPLGPSGACEYGKSAHFSGFLCH